MTVAKEIEQANSRPGVAVALRAVVLEAAVLETRELGLHQIRRDKVAKRAGVAAGTVNNAFGDIAGLKRAVMREAVRLEHLDIIAQGLALRDPIAMGASQPLKARALATLTE